MAEWNGYRVPADKTASQYGRTEASVRPLPVQ
jgi:hypothetical protein